MFGLCTSFVLIAFVIASAIFSSSHERVWESSNSESPSRTCTFFRGIPRMDVALYSSATLVRPVPSALPVERHKISMHSLQSVFLISGAKNILSSSGWAVIISMRSCGSIFHLYGRITKLADHRNNGLNRIVSWDQADTVWKANHVKECKI